VKEYYVESRRKGTSYMPCYEGRLTRLITSCVGILFCNTLLKERQTGREYNEEDLSSYRMTLRKRKCSGLGKRKHYMELSGSGCGPVARQTTVCLNE
jgi:hypothetical protein